MSAGDAERSARAALCRALEPDSEDLTEVRARAHRVGPVRLLGELLAGEVPEGPRSAVEGAGARAGAVPGDQDLHVAARLGLRFVVPGDEEWPPRLADLGARAPFGLYLRGEGHLAGLCERSVAIVGARAATPYGERVAAELAVGVTERGWCVISGAAYGVDAAAHQGALAAGPTVAVLACGADVAYPRAHEGLLARVAAEGVVVSEQPPGAAAHRNRFLARNRLIAALTCGTVVVEGARRSGALSTGRQAERLLRPLAAVPGPVTSALSAGPLQLMRENGAVPVGDAVQLLELVAPASEALALPVPPVGPSRPGDGLDPVSARLLEAVPLRRPQSVARLAATAGVPAAEARRLLPVLGVAGLVERLDGGYRRAPGA